MSSVLPVYEQQSPIVIFDSGVGGLSIYCDIKKLLPSWPLLYFSDNEGFPYGMRSSDYVVDRMNSCLLQIKARCRPALIVVACNTASTLVLEHMRSILTCPIVGVVPAIKTAGEITKNNIIGLLATPATINRAYTQSLIKTFASHCSVISVGSLELVMQAEALLRGEQIDQNEIIRVLQPFFEGNPDCIVLGCTHFPWLKQSLQEIMYAKTGSDVTLIDSGEAIARQVLALLKANKLYFDEKTVSGKTNHIAMFTQVDASVESLKFMLDQLGFSVVSEFPLSEMQNYGKIFD